MDPLDSRSESCFDSLQRFARGVGGAAQECWRGGEETGLEGITRLFTHLVSVGKCPVFGANGNSNLHPSFLGFFGSLLAFM